MKTLSFNQKSGKKTAVLGFFDSLHIGHRQLIASAYTYSKQQKKSLYVFTFSNNPYEHLHKDLPLFYTFEERVNILKSLGADGVLYLALDKEMRAKTFVQLLKDQEVDTVFFGKDYAFGREKEGTIQDFESSGIQVFCQDFLFFEGQKVSTSLIRSLLLCGDIQTANQLLGANYRISGDVEKGYQIGRTLGFPTANILYPKNRAQMKRGVYLVNVYAEGQKYRGISNVGNRPTFLDEEVKVETYIDRFCGNLYGEPIEVEFLNFIRDIRKFENKEALRQQLEEDKKWIAE